MCKHIDSIQHFVAYFRHQGIDISAVLPIVYRKIIYATALDPMARAAFGKTDNHRTRSVRLIDELTNWKEGSRLSLPQLCLALEEVGCISGNLYIEAKARLNNGESLRLEMSPLFTEMEPIAEPKEKCILSSCRYAGLFYTYRNNLVHEFREPGYGMEISTDKDQPYYHSMTNNTSTETWELVFPTGFFARLYSEALVGLEAYLMRNDIDPYSRFEFGSRWRAQ